MTPLSSDPRKRERQLANLNRGATQHSPAPLGNRRGWKHGAYAELTRAELDSELTRMRDALGEDAPLLDQADGVLLDLLATSLVHWRRAEADLAAHGWKNRKSGDARSLAEYARRLRGEAFDYLRELGMTPRARVALGLDVARGFDLARHWQEEAE